MTLLRKLATRRHGTEPPLTRYDADRRISEVFEDGRWVPSWESRAVTETKKADLEKGEDQKGN
jgi:hypothetical protein